MSATTTSAFNTSDGVFLWSRTMTFANCQVIKPPADLRPLCPTTPVSDRQEAPFYIWEANSPLLTVGGTGDSQFTRTRNALARKFAIKAIEAQPLDYAGAVLHGWLLTFSWDRPQVPSQSMAIRYQFTDATQSLNALGGGQGDGRRAGPGAEAVHRRARRRDQGGPAVRRRHDRLPALSCTCAARCSACSC